MPEHPLRFVSTPQAEIEEAPWGVHEWLAKPELTESEHLSLVRVTMPPGQAHQFHRHPAMEEILYCIDGRAEQWVGREKAIIGPGDIAHIPMNEVHGTYNIFDDPVVFIAILSPAVFEGPALIDMANQDPWNSIKTPMEQ